MNFKTEKVSYKVKTSVENPLEKQVIFENHHEPIVDKETWTRVQELRKQRKRPNRYDEVGLRSGRLGKRGFRLKDLPNYLLMELWMIWNVVPYLWYRLVVVRFDLK